MRAAALLAELSHALEVGRDNVQKPYTAEMLAAKVREALKQGVGA